MLKRQIAILFAIVALFLVQSQAALGLEMPAVQHGPDAASFTAHSYIVVDKADGKTLLEKNSNQAWVPASLTKLVTALVFMDTKPSLNKIVVMKQQDEVGGARIPTRKGISYRLNDLLHASLIASANNATEAVARSTGLSREVFVQRMNEKVKQLGATSTVFYEPTGMSPLNVTTSADYAKIVEAAFANKTIKAIAAKQTYTFRSTNNKRYFHNIKNTDKLLGDEQLTIIGGKTGYLDEARYNFATELKDFMGNHIIIVLLGSQSSVSQFREVKELAVLAGLTKSFGGTPALVLGSSSPVSINQ